MAAVLPSIRLKPDATGATLSDALRRLALNGSTLLSKPAAAIMSWRAEYQKWVQDAERTLRSLIDFTDVERLIHTARSGIINGLARPAIGATSLVPLELESRIAVLTELADQIDHLLRRWERLEHFIVLDTSAVAHYPDRFDQADWAALLDMPGERVHLIWLISVVREVQKLKDRVKEQHVRTRTRTSIRELWAILEKAHQGLGFAYRRDLTNYRHGDGQPKNNVTVEMLGDVLGHERMPDVDDEIVDRTLAVERLLGKRITLVTGDIGMAGLARQEGLHVVFFQQDDDVPGQRGPGTRSRGGTSEPRPR